MEGQWLGGKGSTTRPMQVNRQQFEDNWNKIFNKKLDNANKLIPVNETIVEIVTNDTV